MDKYELQKLRDLPIEGVAQRLGLRVVRHKCLCPFHDDHHASLSFSVKRNSYRCFVCGASGGTIDLVMRYQNMSFTEACRWLADEAGVVLSNPLIRPPLTPPTQGENIPLLSRRDQGWSDQPQSFDPSRYERFFERPWLNEAARRFLFEERRIDARVVRWCRLTSWRDRQGVDWFPSGSQCSLYNLPVLNLLRPGDELWITEGCSDCWAMLSAGHKAIAIPSATLLTKKDAEQLSIIHFQLSIQFHMYPDCDAPGERLFLQLQQILPGLVHHQLPPGCKDFSDYYLTKVSQ